MEHEVTNSGACFGSCRAERICLLSISRYFCSRLSRRFPSVTSFSNSKAALLTHISSSEKLLAYTLRRLSKTSSCRGNVSYGFTKQPHRNDFIVSKELSGNESYNSKLSYSLAGILTKKCRDPKLIYCLFLFVLFKQNRPIK